MTYHYAIAKKHSRTGALRIAIAAIYVGILALTCLGEEPQPLSASSLDDRPMAERVAEATRQANEEIIQRNTNRHSLASLQDTAAKVLAKTQPQEPRRYAAVNLEFTPPSFPWVEDKILEKPNETRMSYYIPVLDRSTVVIVESLGVELQLTTTQLLELHQQHLRTRNASAKFFNVREERSGDLDGLRCEALVTNQNGQTGHFVVWVALRNGFAYQILTVGRPGTEEALDHDNCEFRSRLKAIDPTLVAHDQGRTVVEHYKSPAFSYELDLTGLGWLRSEKDSSEAPQFDLAAVNAAVESGSFSCLLVFGTPLPERKPNPAALTKLMLNQLNFVGEGDEILSTKPCMVGELKGEEVSARPRGEGYLSYRIRIVSDEKRAYMICGWSTDVDRMSSIEEALDRFKPGDGKFEESALKSEQRAAAALLLNEIGLNEYASGDHLAALDYFHNAVRFNPSDVAMTTNCASVLADLSRPSEGLAVVQAYCDKNEPNPAVLAVKARLLAESGDSEAARSVYRDLFANGYTDEETLFRYVELAIAAEEIDEGIAAIEEVLKRKPTLVFQRWHAQLYGLKGDTAKSLEMFEQLRKAHPGDAAVALELAKAYELAGEYEKGIELTGKLVEGGRRDEGTLIAHGRLQLHLQQFAAAKETFERAAAIYPHSEAISDLLKVSSSQLGQGDNSALKTPIEPVPIPDVVQRAVEKYGRESAAGESTGAVELSRVSGVEFKVGEPLRSTTSRKVKVYTPSGVARFNNLKFTFKPTGERLYVNSLVVRDEKGRIVAEGAVENYYVVDDGDSGVASHSKIVNIPVPGLKPGYTLEWTVTRQEVASAKSFSFQEIVMASTTPSAVNAFFVTGDVERLKWKSSKPMAVTVKDGVLFCVERNPGVYEYEAVQPSVEDFMPVLWVADASANWADEGREYLSTIEDKLTVDAKTEAAAVELTRHCTDNRERLAVIAAYVQQGYRYQAIEFGRRARIPNSAAKTLELKYGDCKDHALLTRQLLAAVGVESHLAVMKGSGTLVPELASLDQFDHMVLYVPPTSVGDPAGSAGFVVDATQKDADILLNPPYYMAGKSILVLDPAACRIVRIPDYPEDAARITSTRKITIRDNRAGSSDLDAKVEEHITFNDYVAPAVRTFLKQYEPSNRRQAVQNVLSQHGEVHVIRVSVTNLDEPSKPLQLSLSYVAPDAFHTLTADGEKTIVGKLPCPWEHEYMDAEYVDARSTPFEIECPMRVLSTVQVDLPLGYQVAGLNEPAKEMKNKFAAWSCRTSHDQSAVQIEYELRLSPGQHPAAAYAQYYSTIEESLAALEARVTLRESATASARRPGTGRAPK